MAEIYSRQVNDTRIEVFGLNDRYANLIAGMIANGKFEQEQGIDKLVDASDFVEHWLTSYELPEDYRQWLNNSVDAGASIYTYYEDWQPMTEVAVFN